MMDPSQISAAPGGMPTDSGLGDMLDEPGIAVGTQFRIDERYEVEGEAEVVVWRDGRGTSVLRGTILDISATGCYIQTLAPVRIKPHTEVYITFSIYQTTFRLEAISRFVKTKVGLGFRFLEMDDDTRERLQSVLHDIRSKLIKQAPKEPFPVVDRTPAA
jgi:c-di-GMP-binding flagellar brake protein YcgR